MGMIDDFSRVHPRRVFVGTKKAKPRTHLGLPRLRVGNSPEADRKPS
jgi:hypothetical protein